MKPDKTLEQHIDEFEKSPVRKILWVIVALIAIGLCLSVGGWCLGWFGDAAQVAKQEFGPKAALKKYEWFVNQAESLKRSEANIKINEAQISQMQTDYQSTPLPQWPRDAREELARLKQVRTDLVMNYNRDVADYNAQSEKFNWEPFRSEAGVPPPRLTEYASQ